MSDTTEESKQVEPNIPSSFMLMSITSHNSQFQKIQLNATTNQIRAKCLTPVHGISQKLSEMPDELRIVSWNIRGGNQVDKRNETKNQSQKGAEQPPSFNR